MLSPYDCGQDNTRAGLTQSPNARAWESAFALAREERGISLSEAAEQIRIRSVYLAAIEDETWSTIGAAVYIRGFIRTYARFPGDGSRRGGRGVQQHPAGAAAAPSAYTARESAREAAAARAGRGACHLGDRSLVAVPAGGLRRL